MSKIKAFVRMDERNNVRYYRSFEKVNRIPSVGDCYGSEEIRAVEPITYLDPEQDSDEVYKYDYFRIVTTQNGEYNEDTEEYITEYVATAKPTLTVVFEYWDREKDGVLVFSHEKEYDEVLAETFKGPSGAREYRNSIDEDIEEFIGEVLEEDGAINIKLVDKQGLRDQVVSEYFLEKQDGREEFNASDIRLINWCAEAAECFKEYRKDGTKICRSEMEYIRLFHETHMWNGQINNLNYTMEAVDQMMLRILEEDGFLEE